MHERPCSGQKKASPASAIPLGRQLRILRIACLPLVVAIFTACGDEGGGSVHEARSLGLRVGFAIEPPYAFVDSAGEARGEAPQVLGHAARELEIGELQWFPLPFHDLIPALLTGRVDVVASGLFVTPERSRQVRFSRPTICVRPALVVRREAPVAERAGDGGPRAGRIAVVQGSVEARAFEGEAGFETLLVPDLATAAAAVSGGSADALAISAPTARSVARADSTLVLDERPLPGRIAEAARGCAALAFRPADERLAAAFDSVLSAFVGSPAHLDMVTPLGFTGAEMPCAGATASGRAVASGQDPSSASTATPPLPACGPGGGAG